MWLFTLKLNYTINEMVCSLFVIKSQQAGLDPYVPSFWIKHEPLQLLTEIKIKSSCSTHVYRSLIIWSYFKNEKKHCSNPKVWYLHKSRHIPQWNRIDSPEINPHTYCQLTCNKRGKDLQSGKDSLFNNWCLENWTATYKRIKPCHHLIPPKKVTQYGIKTIM